MLRLPIAVIVGIKGTGQRYHAGEQLTSTTSRRCIVIVIRTSPLRGTTISLIICMKLSFILPEFTRYPAPNALIRV